MAYSLPRCARCGNPVTHAYGDVCRECWDEMEYLRTNPRHPWLLPFGITLLVGYLVLSIIQILGR